MSRKQHQEISITKIWISQGEWTPSSQGACTLPRIQQEVPEEAAGQQYQGHELHADAIRVLVKPKEIKPKISKVYSYKLNQIAHIEYPKLGKHAGASASPRVPSTIGHSPKLRLKQRPRLQLWLGLWLWLQLQLQVRLRFPKVSRPPCSSQVEASVCRCEDRRNGVTPALLSSLHGVGMLLFYMYK